MQIVPWRERQPATHVVLWRLFFEALLLGSTDPAALFLSWKTKPALKSVRTDLVHFLQRSMGPWVAGQIPGQRQRSAAQLDLMLQRLHAVERSLGGGSGGL